MNTEGWYYVTPYRKKAGPVTRDRLFALYLKDKILPSTMVWSHGMTSWTSFADKFNGIAPPRVEDPPPVGESIDNASSAASDPVFPLHGRVGRGSIWAWIFSLIVFQSIAMWIVYNGGFFEPRMVDGYNIDTRPPAALFIGLAIGLLMLWPGVSVMVRRCHDLGLSGWWTLTTFVPYLGILILIIAGGFFPGAPGTNRYGPRPGYSDDSDEHGEDDVVEGSGGSDE